MDLDRARISPDELREILAHYDLGAIRSAKGYPRGSRKSPKLLLQTERGSFLLKRRASGKDDPQRVAFSHALLAHLQRQHFPVPQLSATRAGETVLTHAGHTYELFEYISGERFDGSLAEATHAGVTLARYHKRAATFHWPWQPEAGSFHDRTAVRAALGAIPGTVSSHDSVIGHETELLMVTGDLLQRYDEAAAAVTSAGLPHLARVMTHGDWHPGNMLFRAQRVVVVLDFDGARPNPPIVELANGMLQFAMLRGETDPAQWPEYFDESRMRRFLIGYQLRQPVPAAQRRLIPLLMIESLIAETSLPIAVTGSFGHIPGYGVLRMAQRKVRWLSDNLARMQKWMTE